MHMVSVCPFTRGKTISVAMGCSFVSIPVPLADLMLSGLGSF